MRGIGTRKVRTVAQRGSGEVQPREPMSPGEAIIKALDARPCLRKIRRNALRKAITAIMAQPSKKRERARKARRAAERAARGGTGREHAGVITLAPSLSWRAS